MASNVTNLPPLNLLKQLADLPHQVSKNSCKSYKINIREGSIL